MRIDLTSRSIEAQSDGGALITADGGGVYVAHHASPEAAAALGLTFSPGVEANAGEPAQAAAWKGGPVPVTVVIGEKV
jgi:hypothetical protein